MPNETEPKTELGALIRKRRGNRRQESVAKQAGVGVKTLGDIERGTRNHQGNSDRILECSLTIVYKITDALGISRKTVLPLYQKLVEQIEEQQHTSKTEHEPAV